MDSFELWSKIFAGLSLLLIVAGTLTNLLAFVICLYKKSLRQIPTFMFLSAITITDTIALYGLNLDRCFYYGYFSLHLSDMSWLYCKTVYYIHTASLEASAWLLVFMSLERFLSVRIKRWRISMFNSKKATILSVLIIIVFFAGNFYCNFITEFETFKENSSNVTTEFTRCTLDEHVNNTYLRIQNYLYCLMPFTLLAIFNGLMIHTTYTQKKKVVSSTANTVSSKKSLKSMTRMVTTRALLFIVTSCPISLSKAYFFKELNSTHTGLLLLAFFNFLRFAHHSSNLIIFSLFNKKFREELFRIFKIGFEYVKQKCPPTSTKTTRLASTT